MRWHTRDHWFRCRYHCDTAKSTTCLYLPVTVQQNPSYLTTEICTQWSVTRSGCPLAGFTNPPAPGASSGKRHTSCHPRWNWKIWRWSCGASFPSETACVEACWWSQTLAMPHRKGRMACRTLRTHHISNLGYNEGMTDVIISNITNGKSVVPN